MKRFDANAYAEAASRAIDLGLPEHCKAGVAANLERLHAMADALFRFPLPLSDPRDTAE
jgi:hypothetical protein